MTARDLKFMTIGLGITVSISALANVNIPHAFQAGTKIVAEQVNANFAALKSAVDALESGLNARQVRVGGKCEVGSSIREIKDDGTVVCEADDVSSGGSTVSAGDGLNLTNNVLSVADAGISGAKIAGNAVNASHISDGVVGTSEIASGGVTSSDLASDAVTSAKIAANAVTGTKIAANAVDSSKVADGSLRLSDMTESGLFAGLSNFNIPAKGCTYTSLTLQSAAVGDIGFLEPVAAGTPLPETIYTLPAVVTVSGKLGLTICNAASTDFTVASKSFNVFFIKR
jgi:hypothetical protein